MGYRRRGVANIVVVDIIPSRLEKALQVGADAVINSAEEDVAARLVELHGDGATACVRGVRSATDIFLDAAGAPAVPALVADVAAHGATFGVVAVHKRPVELDFGKLLSTVMQEPPQSRGRFVTRHAEGLGRVVAARRAKALGRRRLSSTPRPARLPLGGSRPQL